MLDMKVLENIKRYNFISKSILSNLVVVKLQECPRPWFVPDPGLSQTLLVYLNEKILVYAFQRLQFWSFRCHCLGQ